jgi:hypothetical protein
MMDTAKIEIPEFLIEMSKQMHVQPSRATADPIWQVRCKSYIVTAPGYNESHWILCDDDGEFYRSDIDNGIRAAEYFKDNYEEWFTEKLQEIKEDAFFDDMDDFEIFADEFDYDFEDLPDGVSRVSVQETEEVVSTHLTEQDANWFIKRKQHDYPKLYTYVESAYWSPQIKELRAWILSLTSGDQPQPLEE